MLRFMDKTLSEADRYLVPGLMRGLAVLEVFKPDKREMSLSDIARCAWDCRGRRPSEVCIHSRIWDSLPHDPRRQTYSLGPAVLRLGHGYMVARELVQIALPELEKLRDETDWSAHLGVRDGRNVLYLLRVPSRHGMGSIVHVGSRLPAAATTMGRVLLTDLDEATLVALYRDEHYEHIPADAPRNTADLLKAMARR